MKRYLAAALLLVLPMAATAQDFPITFSKVDKNHFKPGKVAILSYSINFITGQRASANSDVMVRARVSTHLAGVDEAIMRKLANEAHADLRSQLNAAGVPVASDAEVAQVIAAAGVTLVPGNVDRGGDGGIVIGSGVRKQFVSVGADTAPLTTLYQAGGKVGGLGAIGKIGAANKLNKPSVAIDSAIISPSLTIDFADTEASTGRTLAGKKRATASSEMQFAVRATSPVNIQTSTSIGIGFPGAMMLTKDYPSDAPFALAAGVTSATSTAGSYVDPGTAQGGNAVQVDLPRWTALVQSAYRAYNAAIAATIAAARTKK
jgi:hypothetical protein